MANKKCKNPACEMELLIVIERAEMRAAIKKVKAPPLNSYYLDKLHTMTQEQRQHVARILAQRMRAMTGLKVRLQEVEIAEIWQSAINEGLRAASAEALREERRWYELQPDPYRHDGGRHYGVYDAPVEEKRK